MSIFESGFLGLLMSISTTLFSYMFCKKYYDSTATFENVFTTSVSVWWIIYIEYAIVFTILLYFPFYPWWSILLLYIYAYFGYKLTFTWY